ncbi:Nuclear hormone receptor family member nhr-43 [Caenorhabditis elegans]|uniref:Nuclear hormone receptor family member nhr-43 n=1 Tax=Caenorhabditis elegans TaxID=6239 RepID=NHR43_CAEEL|nr:Nuclear hormone receptor family member nhr-43 [Caenorhabditis elegans]Q18299.1 RecName: Full=Nuclear hormone receptor family member nhr-43 [Caenorhabditis elegans]CAA96605.1 Nuclear hormone receptor family member nhr-43 [Caenorhabditis elegans]|eukprot:NP_502254.1 Nuclear Hormone Receptor family [Caenorhabditis elegans]
MISGPFLHFDPTVPLQTVMIGHPATSPLSLPSSSSSPTVADPSNIHCRVCERRYDGSQHFGIDICRACAAFFRRSVAVKKTFVCRRGTNKCELNTVSRKTTCQKCRWMRCLLVGLNVDAVVGRRSPDHVKTTSRDESVKKEDEESDTGSEGKSCEDMDVSHPIEQFQQQISFSVHRPIPTIGNPNIYTTRASLINKVLINYNEFTKSRLDVELSLKHMQQDSKVFGSTGIPIVPATREIISEIYQKQFGLLHIFLKNTFDEYAECDVQEQKRICAMFYPVLWEIESCYWTYRNMPVQPEYETLMMCTQTTYIDSKNVRYWLGNTTGLNESDIQAVEARLENLLTKARNLVLEPMHKLIIKEFEFITLLALNIWAPRNHRGCVSEDRAEQVRDALFDDLHYLYCDGLKIDKYSSRMGEMMCLHTEVQNADMSSTIKNILFSDLNAYLYSI